MERRARDESCHKSSVSVRLITILNEPAFPGKISSVNILHFKQ